MTRPISRRRAIAVLAAVAGVPLVLSARAEARLVRWQGTALGAPASLALYHTDEGAARQAIAAATGELARLETIFSLHRADSALVALNRDGVMTRAPAELVALLGEALKFAELSGGAFDPTMQPLWQVYFRHFTTAAADTQGPATADIAAARALVDWRKVDIAGDTIRLAPGMALSLNGIAQGYITDRVAAVLRAQGLERMLVDMGEPRAVATHPDGSAWRIGIADPTAPERSATVLDVVDKAVSTSGGYGTLFDEAGRFTHLIDPRSGATAPARTSISVIADSATAADALSTALAVTPVAQRAALVAAAGVAAVQVDESGRVTRWAV